MKELTTHKGITVKCSKTAIEFFQNAQSVDFFSVLDKSNTFVRFPIFFHYLFLHL